MEKYSIFYNSTMLNYLGQVLKIVDEYNKKFTDIEHAKGYVYKTSDLDSLLYCIQNGHTIYYVCLMVEAIFQFITTEMGDYIYRYDKETDNGEIQQTCIEALKTFLDKFEKEKK